MSNSEDLNDALARRWRYNYDPVPWPDLKLSVDKYARLAKIQLQYEHDLSAAHLKATQEKLKLLG